MNTTGFQTGSAAPKRVALLAALLAASLLVGCGDTRRTSSAPPQVFSTPDEAVSTMAEALRKDDVGQLKRLLGGEGEDILASGDEVADRQRRQTFLARYDEKHSLASDGADARTLVVGNNHWPFPVPIVKQGGGWVFDAEAGREEIINRRVGENELSAIQVCKAIADAQKEYALMDPDGDGLSEYAAKFASDEGKRNGLYWPAREGQATSPLGELAAKAAGEGYRRRESGPTAYHGYYYRILQGQGPSAPGGQISYVVNRKLVLGFAVVAYPAEYGESGIMTFIMGPDGSIYQKDLGEKTAAVAMAMTAFDPGKGWVKTEAKAPQID